jgi:hypothetical protein
MNTKRITDIVRELDMPKILGISAERFAIINDFPAKMNVDEYQRLADFMGLTTNKLSELFDDFSN